MIRVDQDPLGHMRLDLLPGGGQPVGKGVGHRHEVHPGISVEGVESGRRPPVAAANQAHAEPVVAGGEDPGGGVEAGEGGGQAGRHFQEIAAGCRLGST